MASFVDLQVNGFSGEDFSSPRLNKEGIARVCGELFRRGTGAFLATVVTSPPATYEHVLPLLARAIEHPPAGARILGIHLEGPFVSTRPGAVGVHASAHAALPDVAMFHHFQELSQGKVAVLTLAPELTGAELLIRAARRAGVRIATGHTLATARDMSMAVAAGATLITHLGNGCPNLMHRHNNPIVTQLASGLQPMLIADGHHLPPAFVQMVAMISGRKNLVITSDSAPIAGLPPGEYDAFGMPVVLEKSGRLRCRERDCLAGSSACLLDCMNWLARQGWDEDDLWAAGLYNPLNVLGRPVADIPDAGVRWAKRRFSTSRHHNGV